MKMYFKQRIFSWFDSYDIYDENGDVLYEVKGQLALGHRFAIYDNQGTEVGVVEQKLLTLLPKFSINIMGNDFGFIKKEFTFFKPKYSWSENGWTMDGDVMGWDYTIVSSEGNEVASISKQLFHLSDHYEIDVNNSSDGLLALMFVLAVDAVRCSQE